MSNFLREPKRNNKPRRDANESTKSRTLELPTIVRQSLDDIPKGQRSSIMDSFFQLIPSALAFQRKDNLDSLLLDLRSFESFLSAPKSLSYPSYKNSFDLIQNILGTDHFSGDSWEKRTYSIRVETPPLKEVWSSAGLDKQRVDNKFVVNAVASIVLVADISEGILAAKSVEILPCLTRDKKIFLEFYGAFVDMGLTYLAKHAHALTEKSWQEIRRESKALFVETAFDTPCFFFLRSLMDKLPCIDPRLRTLFKQVKYPYYESKIFPNYLNI